MKKTQKAACAVLLLACPAAVHAQTAHAARVPAIITDQSNEPSGGQARPQEAVLPAALRDQAATSAGQSAHAPPPSPVHAKPQSVPADMPPPIHVLAPSAPLSPKERHGAALARHWRNRNEMPERGEDGSVRFLYGATLPSVVCAPLMVCDLSLQPGEIVQNLNIGDSVRWRITPATSGSGDARVTHVIIKPVDAGLVTDMLIATNRRVYSVKLISTQHDWMPLVAFNYPDDVKAAWAGYQAASAFNIASSSQSGSFAAGNLQFYTITGDNPAWRPIRAYTDGVKTYVELPADAEHQASPVLVALANDGSWFGDPSQQMVNYHFIGHRYVIDSVIDRAALISGVGSSQTKVVITREKP